MKKIVYLDYNATTPVYDSVVDAVTAALRVTGNPSSVHGAGRAAKAVIDMAKSQLAALIDCRARDIVFMSGGTESNNAAIRSSGAQRIIVSAIEHESIIAAAEVSGLAVTELPVDNNGLIKLDALTKALTGGGEGALVSIILASNEIGTIQPVDAIIRIAHGAGAKVHLDAVQALGKMPISFNQLGADYMTVSAHKIGGPKGIGALIMAPTSPMAALITGGGQEFGRRGGTENVPGIAGFGAAAIEALNALLNIEKTQILRDRLETELHQYCPNIIIVAAGAERLKNTSTIVLPGVAGETQVMHMDLGGICVSSGSACSSGKVKESRVLKALAIAPQDLGCSIRVSLGWNTSEDDVGAFIEAYRALYDRTRDKQTGAN